MSNLVAPPLRGGALGAPFLRAFPPRRGGATVLLMIFKNSLSKMFEVSLIFIARAPLNVINDSFLDILSEVLYKINQDVRNTALCVKRA